MLFKDIKQNYPVYILDKQNMSVIQGVVTSVGFPRMDMNPKTGKTGMVVDVTIVANGKTATYSIPENLTVTYAENLVLSTDKQGLVNEIEAMKNTAEQVLASVDHQKEVIAKSSSLLAELNPMYKDKQETEERFTKIESSISRMEEMMTNFINEFKK